MQRILLFGGTGFVGCHYARHILETRADAEIVLCDRFPIDESRYSAALVAALRSPRCSFREIDLRQRIPDELLEGGVDLIANFAAVHREPGHKPWEYYETNLLGADNVCEFAERADCRAIVFTSSISPYGPSDLERDEKSLPVPATPYGASKLAAEKIHLGWQRGGQGRKLLVVRPGVVFGAGEGGNVTRMIRFLRRGLFHYLGNREVRKSGIYVKELCRMFEWGLGKLDDPTFCNVRPGSAFFNASFAPPPSVEEYVTAIRDVGEYRRPVISIPFGVVYALSYFAMGFGGIHPVRMRKLIRPNLILPSVLQNLGYAWQWDLRSALADWKKEMPQDWA